MYVHPARSDEDALSQAKTLSAILAVTVFEAARRGATRHTAFSCEPELAEPEGTSRPLAIERTTKRLRTHVRQLKRALTFMKGAARNKQRGEIKEAGIALKLYVEEANLQKKEIDRRSALTPFQRNPWTAAGECLDRTDPIQEPERSYPTVPLQEVENFFAASLSKPEENHSIPPVEFLGPRPDIDMPWSDIDAEMIASGVSSQALGRLLPGSDTVSNALLKRCSPVFVHIAQVFNDILKFGVCPPAWKSAVTRLIHKGGPTSTMENWRPISLTSCIGKLFHSILSHRILQHSLDSHALDTSVQKGFLPHMNGTVEHTQVLCELIEHQRRHKRQYLLAQFDIKNAFGSIPHAVLLQSLKWARVSPILINYISALYKGASIQIKCAEGLTKSIEIGRGGITRRYTVADLIQLGNGIGFFASSVQVAHSTESLGMERKLF